MVESAIAVITAIRINQGSVGIANAGIDVGDHVSGAIKTEFPGCRSLYLSDIGLDSFGVLDDINFLGFVEDI